MPSGQALHTSEDVAADVVEYLPAPHQELHSVALWFDWKKPAAQAVQLVPVIDEYVPGVHSAQVGLLSSPQPGRQPPPAASPSSSGISMY